jgi:hypothetical protein
LACAPSFMPAVAACIDQPSTTSPVMPANSAWSCLDTAHGSQCAAQCSAGYTAQVTTSWVSTCSTGAWSEPAANDNDNKLVCDPNCEWHPCALRVQNRAIINA